MQFTTKLDKRPKLHTALIGLGKQSIKDHLPAILTSANYTLASVCDKDPSIVREVSQQLNVPGYTNVDDLLADSDFQVAVVAIPHNAYIDVIAKLVLAGKHVIKEKPFAVSFTEAQKLLDVLREGRSYLGVSVQRRFDPIYRRFHQLIKQVGKIYSIEGSYTFNIPDLDVGWRAKKELSGGGALGFSLHPAPSPEHHFHRCSL